MSIQHKFLGVGVLLLAAFASGFWLHKSGRPLNSAIFTIHKITALGAVILAIVLIHNFLKIHQIQSFVPILLLIAGLSVLALFISGGILSKAGQSNHLMLIIHNIGSIVILISGLLLSYFLLK